MRKLGSFPAKTWCAFCGRRVVDEVEYGFIAKIGEYTVHYFCLLLSAKVVQKGEDTEGVLGFLLPDIRREVNRGKNLRCTYCKKLGATIKCRSPKCKIDFHLPCGVKRGSLHQFYDTFASYCPAHVPKQALPKSKSKENITCPVCLSRFTRSEQGPKAFWPICCKPPASLIHRRCMQYMAVNAGAYHFKCPLCNNTDEFFAEAQRMGYYIPVQEPSWEAEGAYNDQLDRSLVCERGDSCYCPSGLTHNGREAEWRLERCRLCGSNGIHQRCLSALAQPGEELNLSWTCSVCSVPCQPMSVSSSDEEIDVETIDELEPNDSLWRNQLMASNPQTEDGSSVNAVPQVFPKFCTLS